MALRTLYQTLLDSDAARLHVIAQQWEIALAAERRADATAELADAMARAPAVERVLANLPQDQRDALDDVLRQSGAMPWAIFTRRWGEVRAVGPGRLERDALWRDPVSPAEGLWYLGLVQRAFEAWPHGQVEMAFVPEELRLYLPEPPPPKAASPEPLAAPQLSVVEGSDALVDELVGLWAALQIQAFDGARAAARWRAARTAPRHALLEALALEQGWLRRDERGFLRPNPDPVLTWLRSGPWTQWSALIGAWMDSAAWNDLAHVPSVCVDPDLDWPNDPLRSRRDFLKVLGRCEPGAWYAVEAFVAYVRQHATDFLRPDGDYDTWVLRDAQSGRALRGFEAWDRVEGALVNFFLTGPLAWLGLVDLGRADDDAVVAFRLSDAGAAVLDLADPPAIPEPPPLRVREDGVVLVPPRRRYERFQLRRIARPVPGAEDRRYRLTPASLARARRQHISVGRVTAFLEQASAHSLPAPLAEAIARAYEGGPDASLKRVWLLRVSDPEVLEQAPLRNLLQETLAPGLALVRAADRGRIQAWLAQNGILPDVGDVEDEPSSMEPG